MRIVTRVFVHASEKTFWQAATVNLAWWEAAQYAAYLTRGRVWSDPDEYVMSLMDSLVNGPPSVGLGVKHVHLGTGVSRDNGDGAQHQQLNKFADYLISTVIGACPNITSVTVYGRSAQE